ncbi:chaperone GrpE [Neisseria shayeganii 871]|uniref:Protein GrpE n=2 Tax=Neisseria shayeganii TaxID=607712 RepID=G4CHV5_9NEIS|nr:chaperone GrpE [Neisseria shayeganii 871]
MPPSIFRIFRKGIAMSQEEHKQPENEALEAEAVQDVAAETAEAETPETVESLTLKVEDLEAQLADIGKYHQADLQNLHRRHQEELQAAHKFASKKFAEELLKVKDYLEMALLDQSGNFEALKMGVEMTLTELKRAFEQAQIQEIVPQPGDKLDPHRHQAFQTVESEQEPNTVVAVMQKGYTLHDRVLRPATVSVAKAKEAAE